MAGACCKPLVCLPLVVGILGILGMLGIVMLSALGVLYLIGKTTQYQSDILIVAWVLFLVPVLCVGRGS